MSKDTKLIIQQDAVEIAKMVDNPVLESEEGPSLEEGDLSGTSVATQELALGRKNEEGTMPRSSGSGTGKHHIRTDWDAEKWSPERWAEKEKPSICQDTSGESLKDLG